MFLVSICRLGILEPAVELRHLRYFVAVAEMENVSRAALKLHVSQPALSRQIRDLEDEIGFCLLERTAKSVRLTDAGRAFLDNARALLQHADEAVKQARAVASAEPTELHVGHSPTLTVEILPKILRAFQRNMPNVHVRLHDFSSKDILERIRDGRLQLGLIVPPTKASELHDLRYEELFHERVCVAVAPQHPFARRRTVPIAEVAAEPLIGLTREDYPSYYDYLSCIFSKLKQKPRVVEEHDSNSGSARKKPRQKNDRDCLTTSVKRSCASCRDGMVLIAATLPNLWFQYRTR